MKLETNNVKDEINEGLAGIGIMITPAISEDYWCFRVQLSEKQAIIGFPKFCTIGIGFQHEEDWNTNLPYSSDKEEIYNHIECNKNDDSITKEDCLEAIELIQKASSQALSEE